MLIKTIIIDDEINAITSLLYELSSFKKIIVTKTFTNVKEAVNYLNVSSIDLLFLDVEMPELNGINFLELFKNRTFEVIFVTAYSNYAFQAYKNQIIDYLLKPVDFEELSKALEKYDKKKETETIIEKYQLTTKKRSIWLTNKGQKRIVDFSEINYCEADGNYTILFFNHKEKIVSSQKLLHFEETLGEDFIRCHHSFLVNKNEIKLLDKKNNKLILKNTIQIPISRQRKKQVISALS